MSYAPCPKCENSKHMLKACENCGAVNRKVRAKGGKSKKKVGIAKYNKKHYCVQCQKTISAKNMSEFLSHYKQSHGRLPTTGEVNQAYKHKQGLKSYSEGSMGRHGPTVSGGLPSLGARRK
jgi:hypothetical protein